MNTASNVSVYEEVGNREEGLLTSQNGVTVSIQVAQKNLDILDGSFLRISVHSYYKVQVNKVNLGTIQETGKGGTTLHVPVNDGIVNTVAANGNSKKEIVFSKIHRLSRNESKVQDRDVEDNLTLPLLNEDVYPNEGF